MADGCCSWWIHSGCGCSEIGGLQWLLCPALSSALVAGLSVMVLHACSRLWCCRCLVWCCRRFARHEPQVDLQETPEARGYQRLVLTGPAGCAPPTQTTSNGKSEAVGSTADLMTWWWFWRQALLVSSWIQRGGRASTVTAFGCTVTESWVLPLAVCESLWKGRNRSISVATLIVKEDLEFTACASPRLMRSP